MLSLVNSLSYRRVLKRILDSDRTLDIHTWPALTNVACKPTKSSDSKPSCNDKPKGESGGTGGSRGPAGGKGKHQIVYKPYVAPCYRDHDHKNMELNRPMSPHLTIYAPTIPAMTSIAQRISGIIVSFYAMMFSVGSLFLSNGIESYVSMIQSLDLSRPSILLAKIIIAFPFAYHYFFGVRFCMWNAGRWLTVKEVRGTVRPLLIATAVGAFVLAII